jgi:CheY-like chemotaxis protein
VLEHGDTPAEAARAREVIARQVEHLTRLVDDLLDLSRVTLHKIRLSQRPLDLAPVVSDAVEALRGRGALGRHDVRVRAESAWVHGDRTRLEQIVSNLVGNAVKFTPPGGAVTISVWREGAEALLAVEDTGIGIPADVLPKIFDLFVQGERGLERAEGGLGIGLTLVRGLVELHGGTIHATSGGAGQGSAFVVRLPAIQAPAAAPREPRTAPLPAACTRRRILLVEDNDDAREMLRLVLSRDGHEVLEARDGRTGTEVALRLLPDVAVIDVGLPGVDGYEVARSIRRHPDGRRMQLVALTGYGQPEDRRRAVDAGFDHHFVKPVDPLRLAAVLGGQALEAGEALPRS